MRIQHNIMAMNAYRNYNLNNKALSGNLEKLSSGYKINRAGDDAAGLAISEKMRAQITGLNAAQKNVKDGISLVKTAEGAMQEIQDMLNRMDYLATQSANGTYADEVDREALQKEVNQLNEEINRIAESANFNGITLLDGTWDADAKGRAVAAAQKAVDAAKASLDGANKAVDDAKAEPLAAIEQQYATVDSKKLITDGVVLPEKSPGSNPVAPGGASDINTKTVLETNSDLAVRPSFKVTLNGTNHVMTGTDATDIDLTIDGTKITIDESDIKAVYTNKKKGDKVSAEELAAVFAKKIETDGAGTANGGAGAVAKQFVGTTNDKLVWNVKIGEDKETLEFNLDAENTDAGELANNLNEHYNVSMGKGANGVVANPVTGETAATKYSYQTGNTTKATAAGTADGKITVNYTDAEGATKSAEVAYASTGTQADAEAEANAIIAELKKDAGLNSLFDMTADTNGKITFTAKDAGKTKVTVTGVNVTAGTGNTGLAIAAGAKTADGEDAFVPGTTGYTNYGTVEVKPGLPAKPGQLANTVIDLSKVGIADGTKITLGNTTYTFAVGSKSVATVKDGEHRIDLTKYEADDLKAGAAKLDEALESAATQMSQISNDIFSVGHSKDKGHVTIQQLENKDGTHVEAGKMTTMDDLMKYIKVQQADPTATEALKKAAQDAKDAKVADLQKVADAAQAKLDEANKGLTAADSVEGGKTLNLQIGDTSDNFNQLGVKIGSMKTTALGVDGLSIATAGDAKDAINTIKNAINYVSSVRGDLGAYQNRLDHTANNLSVMAENIQDAESTIRDTDVAEEMMSYVKNNILVQSAQAMLAQANQVPQGVLQLLG